MGSTCSSLRDGSLTRTNAADATVGTANVANRIGHWAIGSTVAIGLLLIPVLSNASLTECIGTAADGQAKCTAPQVSGYTYGLCRSSSLYIEAALADSCYAAIGGYGTTITQESTLRTLISCMTGVGAPSWMASGAGNGFWCGGSVTRKYGQEVIGVSMEIPYNYGNLQAGRNKRAVCPYGYTPVGGSSDLPDYCVHKPKYTCDATPNPMGIANGDHGLAETDIPPTSPSPLEFTRYYSSSAYYRPVASANPQTVLFAAIVDLNLDWNIMPVGADRKLSHL